MWQSRKTCQYRFHVVLMTSSKAYLVSEDENVGMIHEVSVDIFQRSSGCLGVKQVDERYEGSVEDCPDDVELPAEVSDADGSNLNDNEVTWSKVR